jgi:[NiFe] hydrogenase assembly HybE family chaperone
MNAPLLPTPALLHQRVSALIAHFGRVQRERMVGIPLLNPALQVEAVGFEWAATPDGMDCPVAEGALITPWFMSLLRLPARVLPHGNQVTRSTVRQFGSERFDFIGAHDVAVGYHETCALFSPMFGFSSQAHARDTAQASLALTRPATGDAAASAKMPHPARRAFLLGRRAGTAP